MGGINVSFKGKTYLANMTMEDFKFYKNETPWEKITIKGIGNSEFMVSVKDLTLIGPNLGLSAYCLKAYTGDRKNKKGTQ
jgi:hypothetical protein